MKSISDRNDSASTELRGDDWTAKPLLLFAPHTNGFEFLELLTDNFARNRKFAGGTKSAVTMFILFAAAARAGLISSDL
jgi:hypothetical protein